MSRVLAIDYGSKRVGIAISDSLGLTARALEVVPTSKAVDRVGEIVCEYEVEEVVVGLPRSLGGTDTESTKAAREFAETLSERIGLQCRLVDERFTSKIAESVMIEGGVSRRRRRESVDKLAATVLLQGYLDGNLASREDIEHPGEK